VAIDLAWDETDSQIIRVDVRGDWTWDMMERALEQAIGMMDSVDHKVHYIIDIREGRLDLASAMKQAQQAATPETHRNEGVKVVVGASFMIRTLYSAYRKMIERMGKDQEFLFADTPEEARAMIAEAGSAP
jgi:transposase